MRNFERRLVALEKKLELPPTQYNPEYMALISDDDLSFIADLPLGSTEAELSTKMTAADIARMNNIIGRMRHGPAL